MIELMITVAVVAILAAVAFPSYQSHIRKSKRAEAQSFLLAVASRQQQFLVDTRSFALTVDAVGIPTPSNVSAAYTLQMCKTSTGACVALAAGDTTFAVVATPNADQSSERCGTLSVDQSGAKGAAVTGCW